MPTNNNHTSIEKYFLIGVLLVLLFALIYAASAFIGTLIIAAIIVQGVYPVHKMLYKRLHFPSSISTLISLLLVAILILTPLTLLFFLVANEATDAYTVVSTKINEFTNKDVTLIPSLIKNSFLKDWLDKASSYAPISTSDVISASKDLLGKITSIILGQTTNILKNLSLFLLHAFIFLLAMFYFLRDGDKLVNYLKSLTPLSEKYKNALVRKLSYLSRGIIYGIFGAAIVQGFLVGLGLAIVGVENAVFWGAIAALLSPIPYLGTSFVWVPVVITLAMSGHWISAIFLFLWGAGIVGAADNIVKPYLIGSAAALHPLAVLLVLLGGAFAFGIKGLIFGPFILTLTLGFLHIYALEYKNVLRKK